MKIDYKISEQFEFKAGCIKDLRCQRFFHAGVAGVVTELAR